MAKDGFELPLGTIWRHDDSESAWRVSKNAAFAGKVRILRLAINRAPGQASVRRRRGSKNLNPARAIGKIKERLVKRTL